jgi:hypothetical protein
MFRLGRAPTITPKIIKYLPKQQIIVVIVRPSVPVDHPTTA